MTLVPNFKNTRGERDVKALNSGLISIIVPVYNTDQYLSQCLHSILNQTYMDLEVICIDDGSTDQSFGILQKFASQDSRMKVFRQENQGQGKARNNGLLHASGEFVIFLDSDDWFEPDFLDGMIKEARHTEADITICCSDEFDTNTRKFGNGSWMLKKELLPKSTFVPEEVANSLFQFTYGWAWDKLYRMDFIQREKLNFPDLPNSEDLVFVFASLALASKITVLDQVWIHHRICRGSSVSNSRYKSPEATFHALLQLKNRLLKEKKYDIFKASFQNWSMEFLIWNAANMGNISSQKSYIGKLKKIWFPKLELDKCSADFFSDKFLYYKYLLLRFSPWPVFSLVTGLYHLIKSLRST